MKMRINDNALIKFLVLLLAALLIMIPITWEKTYAATSSVSISDGEPDVGDSFTVTIYYSGDSFGSVDGALTYDPAVLRYEDSTETNVNGGNGELSFSHFQTSGDDSMAITFYFTVIGSGSSSVTAYSSDIYNYDGNSLGNDTAAASFTVGGTNAQTQPGGDDNNNNDDENTNKSSNANLSSLSIACGGLTPAFSPDVTSYTITLSPSETNVGITAYTEDPNANWDVTGGPVMTEDEITRVITVTATDGTTKQYSIHITRNNPTGAIIYNGTYYTPSQNQNISEVPAGFLAGKLNYNDKELSVLKSRDGNVSIIRLVPEGSDDSRGSWFVYNPETKSFTPADIITYDGNKYVVVKNGVNVVYGGPESSSGYQIYDPNTNTLSAMSISGGTAPTEPEETTPGESNAENPEGNGETGPAQEETKPAETKKKGNGLLWFILLLVLALIAALLYLFFRDKFGKKNKSSYAAFDDDEDDNAPSDNKLLVTLAGLKEGISSKIASKKTNDSVYDEEAGMSERRIERRRRIAEAEARNAEAIAAGSSVAEAEEIDSTVFVDTTPISEGSVVTKAELEAAKIAAAEKAREEAARALEEAKAAQEAAAAAIAARDAARAAKARVASSELDSAMEELLEVGEELNETLSKKE